MDKRKGIKIAIAHDFLTVLGGAEKVIMALNKMYPDAPVYTSVYIDDKLKNFLGDAEIRESFVGRLPFKKLFLHQYKLFYHMGFENFDFSDYDIVISSTFAGYSKGIITGPNTYHISYVHNVPRYLWHLPTALHGTLNPIWEKLILPPLEHYWRMWDRMSAQRPDVLVCNSKVVQERVKKFYGRDSELLYPPIELHRFIDNPAKEGDFWLNFGRIEQFKNLDMAIRACIKNKQKLVIAGIGDYLEDLKELTKELKGEKYIEFKGWVEDPEIEDLASKCKGFLFPAISEEFGIVLVEALAAGKPVVAFETVGSKDIIDDGKTGVLAKEFSQEAYTAALKKAWKMKFDPKVCKKSAERFSKANFEKGIRKYVEEGLRK